MKIGIMGGTFDPIHNGHLYIAREALEQLELDEVWWIVSGAPPHKGLKVSNKLTRHTMCHLALDDLPHMLLKDFEMKRPGATYTWESLKYLREIYPEHRFFFIMGEDSLFSFTSWAHPERIAESATIVVAIRATEKSSEDESYRRAVSEIDRITQKLEANFSLLRTRNVPISSTDLRSRIRTGKSIKDFVPHKVAGYIAAHEIYRDDVPLDTVNRLIPQLQKVLPKKRFWHTIGVMETSGALALAHDYPMNRARLAGLLHDCAKCYSNKKLLSMCREYGLPVTKAEKDAPHLLHGKVGAYLAEHEYHVDDPKILHAIAVHTTGEPGMNLLDSIVFTADYIEPGRDKALRLNEIRRMAYHDLEDAIRMILEDTIFYLKQSNAKMDKKTIDTYHWFKQRSEDK